MCAPILAANAIGIASVRLSFQPEDDNPNIATNVTHGQWAQGRI
jgi:hypothetical protein